MSKLNGSPFMFKELIVKRPIFLNTPITSTLYLNGFVGNMGGATKLSVYNSLKASIGEHLERTALYMTKIKHRYIEGYNLVRGEKCEIPIERVMLREEFFDNISLDSDYFNDSSGVASHQNSFSLLNAAFLEYIERQSLVYNWLTATPGIEIDINSITDQEINQLISYTNNFIDHLHIFNISIHSSVNVILIIGYGNEYVGIGLSAHWSLLDAISSALQEFLQTFNDKINKNYINDISDNSKKNEKEN